MFKTGPCQNLFSKMLLKTRIHTQWKILMRLNIYKNHRLPVGAVQAPWQRHTFVYDSRIKSGHIKQKG